MRVPKNSSFSPQAVLPFLASLLLLVFTGPVNQAEAQAGQQAVPFLQIAPDSRSAAMGNSGVARADNANAIFWNPAGLGFQTSSQVGLTHANWLPDFDAGLFYEYLVGAHRFDGVGTFGAHVTFLNLGESEQRTADNQLIDTFRSFDLAFGVSYGVDLNDNLAVGTGVRGIVSNLAPDTEETGGTGRATGFAFDLAALYRSNPQNIWGADVTFSGGANLANMGPHLTYVEEDEALPMNLRFGPSVTIDFDDINSLTWSADFNKTLVSVDTTDTGALDPDPFYQSIFTAWSSADGLAGPDGEAQQLSLLQQFTVGTGLEYWFDDLFAIRTGYFYEHPDNGNRQFLSFGAGVRYNIIGVDASYLYATEDESPLTNTLRFSLLLSFQ